MESHLDRVGPAGQEFKIDYTSELSELSKLKVATTALKTTIRTKLTEALRQKRVIAAVGKRQSVREIQVAHPTFDVKRDRIRELDELRRQGAARTQPWAEAHAVKMFSRRYTKNVMITQGRTDASTSYAAKMVCERLFNQPSKKKRVLERLTSQQMHDIETTELVKYIKKRPLSSILPSCNESQDSSLDRSFSEDASQLQWVLRNENVAASDEGSLNDVHMQMQQAPIARRDTLKKLTFLGEEQLIDDVSVTEPRIKRSLTHQSSSGINTTGVRSPSIISTSSYEGVVECDGDSSGRIHDTLLSPVLAPPAHVRSLSDTPAPVASDPRRPPNTLRPQILNDPDFIDFMTRNNMEPVPSTYISYKIARIGDTIDEQYADQISKALESVLADTAETSISYDSFYKASHKLILQGSTALDRVFMLACFGRRILEGAPELHSTVKNYTDTVMEECVVQCVGTDGEWVSV